MQAGAFGVVAATVLLFCAGLMVKALFQKSA
jgi:hypothetical protein